MRPRTRRPDRAFRRLALALVGGALGSACAHPGAAQTSTAAAPADGPVPPIEVEYERGVYQLAPDGTKTYTYEVAYRVLTEEGAQAWELIEATWAPWRQRRPELAATVTDASGRVHTLDPGTASVSEADDRGAPRRLRIEARIPGVEVGARVEQRVVQSDLQPESAAGASGRFYFGMRVPVARSELALEVPLDLPLAVEARGADLRPTIVEQDGLRRVSYVMTDLGPLGAVDKHLPADVPRHPYVAFSAAPSWAAVATPLSAAVDRSLRGAEVGSLLTGVPDDALTPQLALAAVTRARTLVRSTGRRFGESPRVPMHPEETLARAEGDDEDVAALVVALLRARGLEADLALARAGPGEDVRPDLPGLDGFDRALVRIDGPAPLWLDPIAPYTPPGELPPELQGRWALVIRAGEPALERTPAAASVDNLYVEERIYELPDHGSARVIETTQARGALGARLREQLDGEGDPRDGIAAYVRNQYGRARLGEIELTNPRDLARPVRVRLEAIDADVARVELDRGSVELRGAVLFGWLPPLVRDAALASDEPPEGRQQELRQMAAFLVRGRTADFALPEPYVAELAFEIRPPPGFDVEARPEDRDLALGPASFQARYELADGRLKGRLRFDTGSSVLSSSDLQALVGGLRELFSTPLVKVELSHRGTKQIEAGEIQRGIKTLAGISSAHRASPAHRARLALGLLQIGLGDAARQVAREAVELDQTSVVARYVLGRVLAHDLLGRLHAPGFDRAGAMDALRLVKSMDPGHVRAREELAVLRSTDERGIRFADPAGIEATVAEYRSLRQDTGITAFDDELLEALFRGGRHEEVLLEARGARRSLRRDAHVVAAAVALQGPSAAKAAVAELGIPDAAIPLVETAAATALAGIGRYDAARALLARVEARGQGLGPLAERAKRIESIQAFEQLLRPPEDPVHVVQRLLGLALTGEASAKRLAGLLSSRFGPEALARESERLDRAFAGMARAAERSKVPAPVLRDGILTSTDYQVEGEPTVGYRVRALLEGRRPTFWFVREEQDGFRIVATDRSPGVLGDLALEALDANRRAVAGQWLRWASELLAPAPESGSDPFDRLPFFGLRREQPDDLEAAALALAVLGPEAEPALERAAARAAGATGRSRELLEHAQLLGLAREENWKAALAVATRLARRHPDSEVLRSLKVGALVELERWRPARREVLARLREHPEDANALQQLANLETARGRFDRAEAILERLAAGPDAGSVVFNNLAWLSLFQRDVEGRDLERAVKANALSRGRSPGELHTLAALHAERGDTAKTVELVRRRLELLDATAPESMDYYLFGRVMEHLGLWRLAERAYLRVTDDEGNRADTTHALAQRRLRGLRKRSSI